MSDTIELRDHSQPCEHEDKLHGAYAVATYSRMIGGKLSTQSMWQCAVFGCPGGKKIVLRLTTLKDPTVHPDDTMYVEVKEPLEVKEAT